MSSIFTDNPPEDYDVNFQDGLGQTGESASVHLQLGETRVSGTVQPNKARSERRGRMDQGGRWTGITDAGRGDTREDPGSGSS